eukprot:8901094-Pyramimonas_sp.AAC.1
MTASVDELQGFVADAQGLVDNRQQLAVVAQDASPVYLDCSAGKVLVRTSFLDERQKRRGLRLAAQEDTALKKAFRRGGVARKLSWSIGRRVGIGRDSLRPLPPERSALPISPAPRTQTRPCRRSCRWRSRAT